MNQLKQTIKSTFQTIVNALPTLQLDAVHEPGSHDLADGSNESVVVQECESDCTECFERLKKENSDLLVQKIMSHPSHIPDYSKPP